MAAVAMVTKVQKMLNGNRTVDPFFLYFGGHFGFKMATIANQNGRHMVQHVLLSVNIHFY
jgi:hypothetical protein